MKEQQISLGQQLPQYAVDLLTEELGIAGYLQEQQCQRSGYQPNQHGWNQTGNHDFSCFPYHWTRGLLV